MLRGLPLGRSQSMSLSCGSVLRRSLFVALALATSTPSTRAQSLGSAGTVHGVIVDPSAAVVPQAVVELHNALTQYIQRTLTNDRGEFTLSNIPPGAYHLVITTESFEVSSQEVVIRSNVPIALRVTLAVKSVSEVVQVEAPALVENVAVTHAEVTKNVFSKLPTASVSSGLSDLVTLATPVVSADSNGFFHPMGDHALTNLSIDNQPITDQQGSIFSTQLPPNAVESIEMIYGMVPAEYGDKTSLVINTITRSGLGSEPHGDFSIGYGRFDTVQPNMTLGFGNGPFGNFTAVNVSRSSRFLDSPEQIPLHDVGDNENLFNRFDYKPTSDDALHLNLFYARSMFEIPNTYTQQAAGQDQRQRVESFNIAPGWVRVVNPTTLLTVNPYVRRDVIHYDASASIAADQPATMAQYRTLTNFGVKADVAYTSTRHNVKAGVQINQTNLLEDFTLGLTDPTFNAVCVDADGTPSADLTITDPALCGSAGLAPNDALAPGLVPYDLSRGGSPFHFHGTAEIKTQGVYVQDALTLRDWTLNLGLRWDRYDGISYNTLLQPRLGLTYHIEPSNTILRFGYARSLQTPLNENLILSSTTGAGGLATNVFGASESIPLHAGPRNQVNVGLQQGLGRRLSLDVDAFWKRTHNSGCDLDNLFNTAIYFPIEYSEAKMDGYSARVTMAQTKGFAAYFNVGHTLARVYTPEVGGLIFNAPLPGEVGLLDHDQKLQTTLHLQYQLPHQLPWVALTWRYDSGVVAGAVPDLESLLSLTPNDQQTVGFYCGSQIATIPNPITSCASPIYGTRFVNIPAAGTEDDVTNPSRTKGRHLLDLGVGTDNLLGTNSRVKITARVSIMNLTDTQAMFNFLSTCAGTHFVSPRSLRAQIGVAF